MSTQRQVTASQRTEIIRAIDEKWEMAFLFLDMLSLGATLTDGNGTLDQAEGNVRTFTDELGKQYLTTWCQRCADAALQAELDKGDCRHHEKKVLINTTLGKVHISAQGLLRDGKRVLTWLSACKIAQDGC